GLALAPAALTLLVKFAERFTTRAAEVRVDAPVLLFTVLVSVVTGLLFGLAPAFSSSRQLGDALRQGCGRTTTSRGRQRLRAGLVVAQVAVSFMLLIGAGLMIRSFRKLLHENPGFRPDHLLAMRLSTNFSRYTRQEQVDALRDNILRRIPEIGGVESAALASNFPFSPAGIAFGPRNTRFAVGGRPVFKGELAPAGSVTGVRGRYFQS